MGINNFFQKLFSKKNHQPEISNDEVDLLAELIKNDDLKMNDWDKMFGVLCFNIWNNSSSDFERSSNIQDIEIPFLCAIGVFQNWEKLKLDEKFNVDVITQKAPQDVIESKDALVSQLPQIKSALSELSSKHKIEVIKPFTTIFSEGYSSFYTNKYKRDNPLNFFQKGVETLFLFIMELRQSDPKLYNDLKNYGEYKEDIDLIIEDLNDAFITNANPSGSSGFH